MKPGAPGSKEAQVAALRIKRALENDPSASRRRKTKAPASPAAQPKETNMKTKSKKSKKSKKKPAPQAKKRGRSKAAANLKTAKNAATSNARTKVDGGVRPGSKLEIVVGLLRRPEGCTTADVLKATNWPSVSMPQQAKAAGLTLSKEKDGKVTRYRAS